MSPELSPGCSSLSPQGPRALNSRCLCQESFAEEAHLAAPGNAGTAGVLVVPAEGRTEPAHPGSAAYCCQGTRLASPKQTGAKPPRAGLQAPPRSRLGAPGLSGPAGDTSALSLPPAPAAATVGLKPANPPQDS